MLMPKRRTRKASRAVEWAEYRRLIDPSASKRPRYLSWQAQGQLRAAQQAEFHTLQAQQLAAAQYSNQLRYWELVRGDGG